MKLKGFIQNEIYELKNFQKAGNGRVPGNVLILFK
jgi:hypothetical protein